MKPIWLPSQTRMDQSEMMRFMHWLQTQHNLSFKTYEELYHWSVTSSADFWEAYAIFAQIKFSAPWHQVLNVHTQMMDAQWFVGARLNFAENLLRYQDDHLAIVSVTENNTTLRLTYRELHHVVARCVAAMKKVGVRPGDRVAGFLPNIAESIIAMLATTSMGAIWSSCSPDFGPQAVYDRFSQITPTVLFAVTHYQFKGKIFDCTETVKNLQQNISSLQHTIIVPHVQHHSEIHNTVLWDDFLVAENAAPTLEYAQLPFNHPALILYSSGTTGQPKCIVHSAGGTLIQHLKELQLHTDLKRKDKLLYYTTCGWMMWNWMVSGLATGATLVLYEGAPLYPDANRLWHLIAQEKVTVFGTSARYLGLLQTEKYQPNNIDLSHLKTILSTGSPLLPETFTYVYKTIKSDLCLSSISGGTDIISCFALGCPILPVYAGELQCIGLGLAVKVFNEEGKAVVDEKGELVCVQAFPSMPVGFWQDENRARYHAAYFERFPSVWAHGDYATLTSRHTLIIYGRSDATLKPGGVRIGTAEIYRPLNSIAGVVEGLAVGQEWHHDQRIILFVVLEKGMIGNDVLRQQIRDVIRTQAGPHHVPAKIIFVADLPRTVNGKVAELAVKHIIAGLPVKNRESLANPESLVLFENLPELKED